MSECIFLLVSQIIQVLQLHLFVHIGEDSFCIGKVFVDIIEIGKDNLSPSPELIERVFFLYFLREDGFAENLIQRGNAVYRVSLHVG